MNALELIKMTIKDAVREYFAPIVFLVNTIKNWRWEQGRQGTGYEKMLLLRSTWLRFDVYLLRYQQGSYINWHTDPVETGLRHYRCNVVLCKANGGNFLVGTRGPSPILNTNRIKVFRPDLTEHAVSEVIEGTRYVLSIGWVRGKRCT
jgi:hypothetical protein